MLQVLNLSAEYSNKCPVYGNIVSLDALRIAARANGFTNFVDLSTRDTTFQLKGTASLAPAGIVTDGKKNDVITDYPEQDNSYTILSCFKVDIGTRAAETEANKYRAYVGGSYGGAGSAGGGVGIYILSMADAVDATKYKIVARHVGLMKRKSDGVMVTNYVDCDIIAPVAALPATTGYVYLASSFDHTTGRTTVEVLDRARAASAIRDPNVYWLDSVSRGQNLTSTGERLMHHIGGLPGPDAVSVWNVVTVPEYMFYGRVLSDNEKALQYSASKRFLAAARGIAL